MAACSAACAAPGRSIPAAARRGALPGGDGPPDRAGGQPPLRQVEHVLADQQPGLRAAAGIGDHLPGHEHVAEADAGRSPVGALELADELDAGDLARHRGVAGVGQLDQRDPVRQVELGDQVCLALVRVDRAGMGEEVRRRLVDGADQPAGGVAPRSAPASRRCRAAPCGSSVPAVCRTSGRPGRAASRRPPCWPRARPPPG